MAPVLSLSFPLLVLILALLLPTSSAQQPYTMNDMLDCYSTNASSTLGYSCNGVSSSCSAYLTFRAESPYLSPALIAFLLSADAANISRLNSVSDVTNFPSGDLVVVPISCSCSGRGASFYQHNASYTLKTVSENYLLVANDTYQGLSTCQALMDQNPFDSRNLSAGDGLVVPLRCACPTLNQTRAGNKYLLSYLITWGDDIPTIAQTFHADYQSVLAANELNQKSVIYPFTTLLIPLTTEPTALPPPPPSPVTNSSGSPQPSPPVGGGGSSHTGVIVGVAIGGAVLLLLGALAIFLCLHRRRRQLQKQPKPVSAEYSELPYKTTSLSTPTTPSPLASTIRGALDWITVYKFAELQKGTSYFDEEHRIKGSVYKAEINGAVAAVKRLEGDVSNEISILKQISHSNVIRLSGFCVHEGNTYMVYEYVEMGSLSDWLHHKKSVSDSSCLNWKQRIHIACDVADGLNYLHNYTNPPYIHKNVKSSNVLLDRDFKAKIANFGLARPAEEDGLKQFTRHVVGTQGYMAPEYLKHGLITPMLDVFAFGVVLLELLSGKEATFAGDGDEKGDILLCSVIEDVLSGEDVRSKLKRFVDHCLGDDYPFDLAFATAELAKRCVSRDAGSRPSMNELHVSLLAIYNSTMDWDTEDLAKSGSGSTINYR